MFNRLVPHLPAISLSKVDVLKRNLQNAYWYASREMRDGKSWEEIMAQHTIS